LQDELDTHHPNFNKIFMDNKDEIEKLNLEITTLEGAENTLQNLRLEKYRCFEISCDLSFIT